MPKEPNIKPVAVDSIRELLLLVQLYHLPESYLITRALRHYLSVVKDSEEYNDVDVLLSILAKDSILTKNRDANET